MQAKKVINQQQLDKMPKEVRNFYNFHGVQMIGSNFPVELIEQLHKKLSEDIFDGLECVEIADNQQTESYEVRASVNMPERQCVFLIDHAITFRYADLRKILKQNPGVIPRLESILKYYGNYKPLNTSQQEKKQEKKQQQESTQQQLVVETDLDNMSLDDLSMVQFSSDLVTLSLMNNNLTDEEQLIKKLSYLNLKAMWLNNNPLTEKEALQSYITNKTKIQIYNSKFTQHCRQWGIKYAHSRSLEFTNEPNSHEVHTLDLDGRDIFKVNKEHFKVFQKLKKLSIKQHSIENDDEKKYLLELLQILENLRHLYVDESVERILWQAYQDKQIPLKTAKRLLINNHSLLNPEIDTNDTSIDFIAKNIFKLAGCYRLANSQKLDETCCWYINEQFASMIPHSDKPNIKMMPFLYAKNNKMDGEVMSYSVMWNTQIIKKGDLISRDFLYGMAEEKQRSSRLAIWYKLPQPYYLDYIKKYDQKMFDMSKQSISLLEKFYSVNAIKQKEQLNKLNEQGYFDEKHKVIAEYEHINTYLKHERFEFVTNLNEATVIWLVQPIQQKQWQKYKGKFYINQFPFESCVVMKQNLADTIQSVFGDTKFLMRTYDLEKQLHLMVGDYYKRQKEGHDNLWIVKPPNMARSMDMIITDNLSIIIKSMETGPKIAQKYISNPVLRRGRKVDLRYILLVKSISPLTLFLYKNFWIRSSNNEYTVDSRYLSTYQTQFTVMNYGDVTDFKQIGFKDFIEEFQKDYKTKWTLIHEKIKKMLRNTFIAVATKYPQMHDDKSRAVYGIDIMVDEAEMQPKLLEITFSPDCKRACEYYPSFYNDVFETLYLDEGLNQNMERII